MEFKGTKGKWTISEGVNGFIIWTDSDSICKTARKHPLDKYNAHIIAAAPDLVKALITARQTMKTLLTVNMIPEQAEKAWTLYAISPEMVEINEALWKALIDADQQPSTNNEQR